MKKGKSHLTTILLVVVLLAGLSLLLYPSFSETWNSFHQSRAIASYAEQVATLDDGTYDRLWQRAQAYNAAMAGDSIAYALSDDR